MTIKRNINQKCNEKNKKDGQEQQNQNVRTQNVHRNVVGTRTVVSGNNIEHGQSPQRRSEIVYDEMQCRHRRSPHKNTSHQKRNEKITTNNNMNNMNSNNNNNNNNSNNDRELSTITTSSSAQHSSTSVTVTCHSSINNNDGTNSNNLIMNTNNLNNNTNNMNNNLNIAGCSSVTLNDSNNISGTSSENLLNINNNNNNNNINNNLPQTSTNHLEEELNKNLNNSNLNDIDVLNGYNSGDEHLVSAANIFSLDEWNRRDKCFMNKMKKIGFIVKEVAEDGACLFRAISLQILGNEELHERIRAQTMNYIYQNRGYFKNFVTEDIENYVQRKRSNDSHGNHIEIQAISEIYNRKVELYCYQTKPINTFNDKLTENTYEPLRLSYQRGSHYNAIIDSRRPLVNVDLDLAGFKSELQTNEAIKLSEQQEIEQAMFEDKIKSTDWEATDVEIVEQIARESYLQYRREYLQNNNNNNNNNNHNKYHCDNGSGSGGSNDGINNNKKLFNSSGTSSTITSAEFSEAETQSFVQPILANLNNSIDSEDLNNRDITEINNDDNNMQTRLTDKSTGGAAKKLRNNPKRLKNNFKKISLKNKKDNLPNDDEHVNKKKSRIQLPGTSKDEQFSMFHYSLLESSYDGTNQLTEKEMIQKAIQMSQINFIEEQKLKFGLNDDDST